MTTNSQTIRKFRLSDETFHATQLVCSKHGITREKFTSMASKLVDKELTKRLKGS